MLKKIEIGALIIMFASIFFFRLFWTTFKERVEIGSYVEIIGRVDASKGRVDTINGKYPTKNIYFLVDRVPDGEKIVYGRVKKIEQSKWGTQYSLEVERYKEKKGILKEFYIDRIKKITEDYSIDLEHFLRATILGEGYLLMDSIKEMFRYTGTAHILVISGLHIGVIILGMDSLFLKLNLKKQIRYILILCILTVYVCAIGKSPSVFRAYIMAVIYLLGNILYEKVNSGKSLILAFGISLLVYPAWIYSISFWMSYVAVFSIIFIYKKIPKLKNRSVFIEKVLNVVVMTFVIQIFMTPIFYMFFKTVPIFSIFSNILIIPIASIFIVTSFLTLFLSNFYLGFLTAPLVYYSYIILIRSVDIISKIPYLTLEL